LDDRIAEEARVAVARRPTLAARPVRACVDDQKERARRHDLLSLIDRGCQPQAARILAPPDR
jgi:hypothetical protein